MKSIMLTGIQRRRLNLLNAIRDAHHRMATNTDENYRAVQREKCNNWLAELTELYRDHPELIMEESFA